jgi:hypothetical protein
MLHRENLREKNETYEIRHDNNGNAIHVHIKNEEAVVYASLLDLIKHRYWHDTGIERFYISEEDLTDLYSSDEYGFEQLKPKMQELQDKDGAFVDLFEHPDRIPSKVRHVLRKFNGDEGSYEQIEKLKEALNLIGYTISYGLDCSPFGLRPIGVKLNQLKEWRDYLPE